MDIRESVPSALELEGQPFMINTQQVHQGSLKIMYVYRILNNAIPKIVCFSVSIAFFYSCPCHEYGEASGMVIPTKIIGS